MTLDIFRRRQQSNSRDTCRHQASNCTSPSFPNFSIPPSSTFHCIIYNFKIFIMLILLCWLEFVKYCIFLGFSVHFPLFCASHLFIHCAFHLLVSFQSLYYFIHLSFYLSICICEQILIFTFILRKFYLPFSVLSFYSSFFVWFVASFSHLI